MSDEHIDSDVSETDVAKARAFVEAVDALAVEHFGEPTEDSPVPSVIVGVQIGDMGVLSSNLSVCGIGHALHDMMGMAAEDHARFHADDGPAPYMDTTDLSQVPEDVLAQARALAEQAGIPFEDVIYRQAVRTDDVTDEGLAAFVGTPFDPEADPEPGERPVLTGDDDISQPHETAKDIRDISALGDLGDDSEG